MMLRLRLSMGLEGKAPLRSISTDMKIRMDVAVRQSNRGCVAHCPSSVSCCRKAHVRWELQGSRWIGSVLCVAIADGAVPFTFRARIAINEGAEPNQLMGRRGWNVMLLRVLRKNARTTKPIASCMSVSRASELPSFRPLQPGVPTELVECLGNCQVVPSSQG